MAIIQLKRTTTTTIPSSTEQGEMFYVYGTASATSAGQDGNGQKLFIGDPSTNTDSPKIIGGEFYTRMLNHAHGTLTANTAIVVNADKKIDNLKVDNLDLNANAITSTNTNGDVEITPNGNGFVKLDGLKYPRTDGTAGQFLKTDGNGELTFADTGSILNITGSSGSDAVDLATETLAFTGTGPVTTAVTDDQIAISVADATVSAKGIASFATADFSVTSGAVVIKTSGVSNDQLAGSIANTKLANDSVTIGTTEVDLGASSTAFTGLTSLGIGTFTVTQNTLTTSSGNLTLNPDGNINASNNKIENVAEPTSGSDAATKSYVDAVKTGLDIKGSVKVATTANITLSNTQTIDGISLSAGDRVLVKNQSTASENGIYDVVSGGSWTRSSDANANAEVTPGLFTFVEQGTVYSDTGWVLTTNAAITLDSSSLTFTQFSGAGTFLAGTGLALSGNTFNVGGTTDRISVTGTAVDISANYVGQNTITTLGTIATGTWQGTTVATGYGGTGLTSYTAGDLLYSSSTNTLGKLGIGSTGEFLIVASGAPSWTDIIDGGTYS